jgi:hypothetical protein
MAVPAAGPATRQTMSIATMIHNCLKADTLHLPELIVTDFEAITTMEKPHQKTDCMAGTRYPVWPMTR